MRNGFLDQELEERIKATLESDKLVLKKNCPVPLRTLIRKNGSSISPNPLSLEINDQELASVCFYYPEEDIDTIIGIVQDGRYRSLQDKYSPYIVEYQDIGRYTARFTVKRYSAAMVYFPNFTEWTFFTKQTAVSWGTEVASWDDPGDLGDGVHESGWHTDQKVYGPLEVPETCLELIAKAYNYRGNVKDILNKSPPELSK